MSSITGLTAAEVEARRAAGQTNQPPKSQTKTTGEIVRDNVCTYFNLVFLVLAVMLAFVHSWLNMGFLGIVFWNTLIGIVQQLRAKRTIDKLTLSQRRSSVACATASGARCCPTTLCRTMLSSSARVTRSQRTPSCWTAVPRRTNPSLRARRGPFPRSAARS